jgi:ATP-dependent RNA helicase DeaD
MINVLLSAPDEATLAFTKTREGASELAAFLVRAGFSASALTGDMEQSERTRALESFRSGRTRILAATDVAARGIDLPDVTRVIHADPPGDPESYTHRSGRTGRAGRKGTSVMFVPPAEKEKVRRLLRRAGIYANLLPIPSFESVREAQALRLVAELSEPSDEVSAHAKMADRVVSALEGKVDTETLVRRLLLRVLAGSAEPRELSAPARAVRAIEPDDRGADRADTRPSRVARAPEPERAPRREAPAREGSPRPPFEAASRPERPRAPKPSDEVDFVAFRVTWGSRHGADVRRLMAMSCRRGDVRGADLGAILVGPDTSIVEVRADVADDFERASKKPDPRDPRVRFARTEHGRDSRPGEAPSSPYLPVLEDEPRPRPRWVGGNTRPKYPGKRPPPRR